MLLSEVRENIMKKIAILGPVQTATYYGGVAAFNENLARGFSRLGYEATIYSNQKDVVCQSLEDRVHIQKLQILRGSKDSFDLVIASLNYLHFLPFFRSSKKIYFLHGIFSRGSYSWMKFNVITAYQKLFLKAATHTLSVSQFTRFMNKDVAGIHSDGVVYIGAPYTLIDQLTSYSTFTKQPKTILFVGKLSASKQVFPILKALKELNDPSFKLTVIGDGPDRERLETYVREHGLNCEFLGRRSPEEIVQFYQESEIFVSLGRENFGTVFCEALCFNCKIISPTSGGPLEYLKDYMDRTALVDHENSRDIAAAIRTLATLPAPQPVDLQRFTYEYTVRQILDVVSKA